MVSSECELDDDSATVSEDTSATKTDSETETDEERSSRFLPFEQDEKVLALYRDTWYPARVRTVQNREKERPYLVHYLGWKEKWDEWVGADRLLKLSDVKRKKRKKCNDLPQKREVEGNLPPGRALQSLSECHSDGRGRKQNIDSFSQEKGAITSEKLMNLHIPPRLKKQLTDDCDFITHQGKLIKLPCSPSVNDIIEKKYVDYRFEKDGRVSAAVQEFAKALENYFNRSLPLTLLYKSERQQFRDAIKDFIEPSTVYGAEHLLRLFVKPKKHDAELLISYLICIMSIPHSLLKIMHLLLPLLSCPTHWPVLNWKRKRCQSFIKKWFSFLSFFRSIKMNFFFPITMYQKNLKQAPISKTSSLGHTDNRIVILG